MILNSLLLVAISLVTPEQFGAKGDCITDDSVAIKNAIASVSPDISKVGQIVQFSNRCYYSSQEIIINKSLRLLGETGRGPNASTIIKYPKNVSGLKILSSYVEVSNIEFLGGGGTSTTAHGIIILAGRSEVNNCRITKFSGNGIHIRGNAVHEGTNSNLWKVLNVVLTNNGGWGLKVSGADANAGLFMNSDTTSNKYGCILDDSFLGNTYFRNHCSAASKTSMICEDVDPTTFCGIKTTNNNARSLFLEQYVEGSIPVEILYPSIRFGGIGGLHTKNTLSMRSGTFTGPRWEFLNNLEEPWVTLGVGGSSPKTALTFENKEYSSKPLRLQWEHFEQDYWEFNLANLANSRGAMIAQINKDGMTAGSWNFPSGIWTGIKADKRRISHSSGIPKTGLFQVGDLLINRISTIDSCVLLICLKAGDASSTDLTLKPAFGCVKVSEQVQ